MRLPTYGKTLLQLKVQTQGIPKTTVKFDNLLEGFTELGESCYPHSLLQGKGKDQNQSKEETHRAESEMVLKQSFSVISHAVRMSYPLDIHM